MNTLEKRGLVANAGVIFNPRAGCGDAEAGAKKLAARLELADTAVLGFQEYLSVADEINRQKQLLIVLGGDGTHTSVLQQALVSELADPLFVLLLGYGGEKVLSKLLQTNGLDLSEIEYLLRADDYQTKVLRPLQVLTSLSPEQPQFATWLALGGFTGLVLQEIEAFRASILPDKARRVGGTFKGYLKLLLQMPSVEVVKPNGSVATAFDGGVISGDFPRWGKMDIQSWGAPALLHIIGEYASLEERRGILFSLVQEAFVKSFLPSLADRFGSKAIKHIPLQENDTVAIRLQHQLLSIDSELSAALWAEISLAQEKSYREIKLLTTS